MLNDFAIDGALRFELGQGGLTRAVIETAECRGEIYLHGGHITSWQPSHAKQDVLFMSSEAVFAAGEPIRGGVPICYPWFGPHPAQSDAPNHGLVRTEAWDIVRTDYNDGLVTVELAITCGELHANFVARFGETLNMALTTDNQSQDEQVITEALHTYFAIDDIRNIHITGLEGATYLSKVENGRFTQENPSVTFTGETDRVYLSTTDTCTLHDPGLHRDIIVEKLGSRSTVVWNPWAERAAAIGDLGSDDWERYACIETANALDDAVTVKPGASHTVQATIKVESTG